MSKKIQASQILDLFKSDLEEIFDRIESLEQFDEERWETVRVLCKRFEKLRKTSEEYTKQIGFFIEQNNKSAETINGVIAAQTALLRSLKSRNEPDGNILDDLEKAFLKMMIE